MFFRKYKRWIINGEIWKNRYRINYKGERYIKYDIRIKDDRYINKKNN